MTIEKHKEVITKYRALLESKEIPKKEFPKSESPTSTEDQLAHCHWMLDQMGAFLDQGNIEKVNRWLGFVQGNLWKSDIFTVEDLEEHNRPD